METRSIALVDIGFLLNGSYYLNNSQSTFIPPPIDNGGSSDSVDRTLSNCFGLCGSNKTITIAVVVGAGLLIILIIAIICIVRCCRRRRESRRRNKAES